ncbi:NUDIX hydrolase [Nonomuraea zeae]|uniref:NUDIX domain-containing protein n=1 Tax=Nonomuraea zeae TaxID=1642303 RepID=A0A5S4GXQ1_9ACTN|nr:NUDIX domain-containing protein [Nonomuraea zeae]TMR37291.1 NUDIX domain-containing protein [Nonomuraea zeae]
MPDPMLRRAARVLILDQDERVLLCRLDLTSEGGPVVWAAPGGGIEPGESGRTALRRELDEEIGFDLRGEPAHVWRQAAVGPRYAPGYDGVRNDYYVVRTESFEPRGALTDERLAAEFITRFRWWSVAEIAAYRGTEVFSPRALADLLGSLLADGLPARPLLLGL